MNTVTPPATPLPADATQAPGSADAPSPTPPGWLASLQSIWHELPGLVGDRVDLLWLELEQAGRALAQIALLLVAAAVLGVTAWLAVWAGVAIGLVAAGLHWALALLLVVAVHAGAIAWAFARIGRLLPRLGLHASRRHAVPGQPAPPAATPATGAAPPA